MFKKFSASLAAVVLCALGTLSAPSSAVAGVYIDNTLGELKAEETIKVPNPKPVQLLVEFQTGGVLNARATKFVKPIIAEAATATGVVGTTSETPLAGGARLAVIMNDIPEKNVGGKAFMTGFTFGLSGTVAHDDYDIEVRYTPGDGQDPIIRTVHHRLYIKLGLANPPENATKVEKVDEAVKTIVRQALAHALNGIAGDPRFAGVVASPALAPAAAPQPAVAPAAPTAPAPVAAATPAKATAQ